jgi:hypothetical protein
MYAIRDACMQSLKAIFDALESRLIEHERTIRLLREDVASTKANIKQLYRKGTTP